MEKDQGAKDQSSCLRFSPWFQFIVNSAEGGSLIGGQLNWGLPEVQGVAWMDKGSFA